jgi:Ribbon-helix-helix protein, copG family
MSSQPVSVALRDDVADAIRREASRTGRTETEVVEVAVRRLVAPSVLDRLWKSATLSEDEAMTIAIEETRAARAERHTG